MRRGWTMGVFPAAAILAVWAAPATAGTSREGKIDLLFGLGAIASQEATIDSTATLEAGDGATFEGRFRFHFNENFAIEGVLMTEAENTDLEIFGLPSDSVDTTTDFFLANAVFNLTRTPVSPFVSAGVGFFSHTDDDFGLLEEDGPVFDLAAGVDGRTDGRLIWAIEARWLNYEFEDFDEDWKRIQYIGLMGFHF